MSDYRIEDPRKEGDIHYGIVGTLKELEEEGLDPAVFGSCARPIKGQVRGCAHYNECRMSYKGVAGKRNCAVEVLKSKSQGGGIIRRQVDCVWVAKHAPEYEANGGVVTVIADEGETYTTVEGICYDPATGKEVAPIAGWKHRKDMKVERVVAPFPRPSENAELTVETLRTETARERLEELNRERRDRALGIQTENPTDHRRRKTIRGGKTEGGGQPDAG